jgi:hypothetical protein
MIPLAGKLKEMNHNVFIGSGEKHLALFRNELPGLSHIEFPGFKPGYSRFLPQFYFLLLQAPLLLYHIIREHLRLKKIIRDYGIDIVISDNRFGLWNKKVKTVYVTHMPLIPVPKALRFLEFAGIIIHRAIIKKYSYCFIPDLPGEINVSGRLSHGLILPDNVRFTGILSRFILPVKEQPEGRVRFRHNTVILSGPEPQRGLLKKKLTLLLKNQEPPTVILEGKPGETKEIIRFENIFYYNHLPAWEMADMITGSERVITRSGYTTIMELISLNCSALLIPTPGQTEQEYLAEYLSEKGWFSTIRQNNIEAGLALPEGMAFNASEIIGESNKLLKEALKELLEDAHNQP